MKVGKSLSFSKLLNSIPMGLQQIDYLPVAMRAIGEFKADTGKYIGTSKHFSSPFDGEMEKTDLQHRANWLLCKVLVSPQELINSMPTALGRYYQGQWAIYACAMTAIAVCNIVRLYPDLHEKYIPFVPSIIELLMSEEVRYYDTMQWKEDALGSLEGSKSHMTYLSLLAWVISTYELTNGEKNYDALLKEICEALTRRMLKTTDLNLPSFPNGIVFLPDMMVTIIALKNYGALHNHEYDYIVEQWVKNAKELWLDKKTGLIISKYYPNGHISPLQGSYSALNCTYLTMIDEDFAKEQYARLKETFIIGNIYPSVKEFLHKAPSIGFNVDAGPIIEGRSPSGTAFALGAATFHKDWTLRQGLLKTAELAGNTIVNDNSRHYKLAELMLTGEAITLAMRTNVKLSRSISPSEEFRKK